MKSSASKGISYSVLAMNTSASLDSGMCLMSFNAEIFMFKYTIAYKNNLQDGGMAWAAAHRQATCRLMRVMVVAGPQWHAGRQERMTQLGG